MIKASLEEIIRQIAALEAKYPAQEMRPWACNDHPIAVEHWRLVQQRINLRRKLGKAKPGLTVEQRVAAGQRLREGKRAASGGVRENGIAPRFLVEQIDAKVKGDPDLPRA